MLKAKYENLEELLKEVKATHSLNTEIDFICHVQDLIGHTAYDELPTLASEYKETFYRVYDTAEGIESTLRFFAQNSKFSVELQEKLADAEADRDKMKFLLSEEQKKSLQYAKERNEAEAKNIKLSAKNSDIKSENDRLKAELTALKAKLYDLMTA